MSSAPPAPARAARARPGLTDPALRECLIDRLPATARFALRFVSARFRDTALASAADLEAVRGLAAACAREGDVPLLAWLLANGGARSREVFEAAAAGGSLAALELLRGDAAVIDYCAAVRRAAARAGHAHVLAWLAGPDPEARRRVAFASFPDAVLARSVAVLDWVKAQGALGPIAATRDFELVYFYAAWQGDVPLLDWFVANAVARGATRGSRNLACAGALHGDHVAIFERFYAPTPVVIELVLEAGKPRFLDVIAARGWVCDDPQLIEDFATTPELRDWFRARFPAAFARFLAMLG